MWGGKLHSDDLVRWAPSACPDTSATMPNLCCCQLLCFAGTLPSNLLDACHPTQCTIDLSLNQLQGSLPAIWANATWAGVRRVLSFAHNNLTSSIPAAWRQMLVNTSIDVSYNQLNGSLPWWTYDPLSAYTTLG
jgi:hypothetical protein